MFQFGDGRLLKQPKQKEGVMDSCELHKTCFFFNDAFSNMPQILGPLREKYCNGNFAICSRYKISQTIGRDMVPTYLYPNGFFETRIIPESSSQVL